MSHKLHQMHGSWQNVINEFKKHCNDMQKNRSKSENTWISAPKKKLKLLTTKSVRPFRKSSNEIKKQFQILAKGHNVNYEIVNPMNHTRAATDVISGHVPENDGTWQSSSLFCNCDRKAALDVGFDRYTGKQAALSKSL
jgi:hypothetical protein